MQDGDVLFLGESDLILITTVKTLGGAIVNTTRLNRFDVVDYLRQQSNYAADSRDANGTATTAHPLPAVNKSIPSGLPTSVSTAPPVHTLPPEVQTAPDDSCAWDTRRRKSARPYPRGNDDIGSPRHSPRSARWWCRPIRKKAFRRKPSASG